MEMRKLLDKREVAALIGVAPRTINELVRRGDFPRPLRVGKIVRWTDKQIADWVSAKIAKRP